MYDNRHHEFDYQYNHRFGFHMNSMVPAAVDTCLLLKPPVVKVLDPNVGVLRQIKANRPDTLIVYRRYFADQRLGRSIDEAYGIGRERAKGVLEAEAVRLGLVDLAESYNERLSEVASDWEHALYSRFMIGFHDECERAGFPVEPIAFNFGAGNGSAELLLRSYLEVLSKYKWLGFHEYDWPTLDRLDQQGLEDGNGGKWLTLRYQRILDPIVEQMGDRWSVLITECGMTQGVLGGDDLGPWAEKNTVTQPPWNEIRAPIPESSYWDSLLWYNEEIMADPRVAGVCLFVTGAAEDWSTFEHVPTITDRIAPWQKVIDSIPSQPPEGEMKKTQVYIKQADGEFVGMTFNLPDGASVNFEAVPDAESGKEFSHWTDHSGQHRTLNPLVVPAGASLSLTAHFRNKESEPVDPPSSWWPYSRPLVGLHGRNDYNWYKADRDLVREAKIEAVSFMGHTKIASFAMFQSEFPDIPIITRIYNPELQNEYFNQGKRPNPNEYVERVRFAIAAQAPYCQIFRVHNEPNHKEKYEGWGSGNADAYDFNIWFINVLSQLRREFPDLKFLFPNLAQGDYHNDLGWVRNCLGAIKAADGWCASCYWQNFNPGDKNHLSEDWGMRFVQYNEIVRSDGVTRPIFIAEAGNSNHHSGLPASEDQIAREMVEYYQYIMANHPEVYAVMPFLMSSSMDWHEFAWREEPGRFKQVVNAVGAMQRR